MTRPISSTDTSKITIYGWSTSASDFHAVSKECDGCIAAHAHAF